MKDFCLFSLYSNELTLDCVFLFSDPHHISRTCDLTFFWLAKLRSKIKSEVKSIEVRHGE